MNSTIIYKSKCCRSQCPTFLPSACPPLSAPLLPGKNPDKTPPVLAGKPSRYPDDCSAPPFSSCSSHRQQPSCLGSEKLICSTDELLRSTRLSANVDVEWMEGRFKEEHVWTDRVRWCTSVCVCVSLSKFAYVNLHLHKLDATQAACF